jgi:peptidoglycan-associated lipoprotein
MTTSRVLCGKKETSSSVTSWFPGFQILPNEYVSKGQLAWQVAAIMLVALFMNSTFRRFFALVRPLFPLLFLLVLLPGCGSKNGEQNAGSTGDYVNGTPLPDRQEGTSFMSSNVDRQQFQPIYFAFDSQTIGSSENGKIQQIASFMKGGNSQIIIAGFTDERGTAEYNRGLGERRAESVREALIADGANAQSIQTVSFGAEMPADPASNEQAWAKNRRAEIGVVK